MEPTEALRSVETALRLAVKEIFGADTWLNARGAPSREALEERRTEEAAKRDGVVVSNDLLDYTQTYHLTDLVEKNWDQFQPVFKDKARTTAYFSVIKDVRNSVAHSRDLVSFERDLLSGIAGHLRNLVSLHRSQADESSRYYPRIEVVRDSFGQEGVPEDSSQRVRINVGDAIEFSGSAFNAKGKTVNWFLHRRKRDNSSSENQVATGDDVTFTYVVAEEDVGEYVTFRVYIAADSKYHRYHDIVVSECDDSEEFLYAVNPPDDE